MQCDGSGHHASIGRLLDVDFIDGLVSTARTTATGTPKGEQGCPRCPAGEYPGDAHHAQGGQRKCDGPPPTATTMVVVQESAVLQAVSEACDVRARPVNEFVQLFS